MSELPLVSIQMPAFNTAEYIEHAIQSCIDQTYQKWELIVVDDGSDDGTHEIAQEMAEKDSRIKVYQQDHKTCPVARNFALSKSSGKIIVKQDSDDMQHPQRIEKQVSHLLRHPECDIVSCDMSALYPSGRLNDVTGKWMDPLRYMSAQRGGSPITVSIVAWKSVYDEVGPFCEDQIAGSDGDWNMRTCVLDKKWGYIPEVLYVYRLHEGQISKRLIREQSETHAKAIRKYAPAFLPILERLRESTDFRTQWRADYSE